jgi:hypothetical protein
MFGKYNGFVSKARISACMYFLVKGIYLHDTTIADIGVHDSFWCVKTTAA